MEFFESIKYVCHDHDIPARGTYDFFILQQCGLCGMLTSGHVGSLAA